MCVLHSTPGTSPDTYVYKQDKPSQVFSLSKCRDYIYCARNKDSSPKDFLNGTCTANPPDCGTKNKVYILMHVHRADICCHEKIDRNRHHFTVMSWATQ